ncbi:MAG TPA: hypothetical protein VHJ78_01735, partial [Actinomycetota bacterium]|nr:hypothetical protein [Actinomycetota bacterium]
MRKSRRSVVAGCLAAVLLISASACGNEQEPENTESADLIQDIFFMNADGSNPQRITDATGVDSSPDWSPDGTKIAFNTNRDGNFEIYVMNADGSNPRRLTNNNAEDFSPDWSPDGRQIAFNSDRDGNR